MEYIVTMVTKRKAEQSSLKIIYNSHSKLFNMV